MKVRGWPAIGRWFVDQSALSLFAGRPILVALALAALSFATLSLATLRRATA